MSMADHPRPTSPLTLSGDQIRSAMTAVFRSALLATCACLSFAGAARTSLFFDVPANLAGYSGFCVTAGSPDPAVPTRRIEQTVIRQLQALQFRAQPMGEGVCAPLRLKTGQASGRLVLSVEVSPLARRGEYLSVIRVNDPHVRARRPDGRTRQYDAVLWLHAEHLTADPATAGAWRAALNGLAHAWSLSRLQP